MSVGLLLASGALLCWPTVRTHPMIRAARAERVPVVQRMDRSIPFVLAVAVLTLAIAWKPTVLGIAFGIGAAAAAFVLLRRTRRRAPVGSVDAVVPLVLTVAALLLRSGTPPGAALAAAARSCRSTSRTAFEQVERRLAMGEPPGRAWSSLSETPGLAGVGRAAIRASESGTALAQAWTATSERLRADRRLAAEIRARKVGVRVLAPLGLCFLPSFVCLGVVPMVIGLAGEIL